MKLVSSSDSHNSFELAILGYGETAKTWRDRNQLQCRFSTFWNKRADIQLFPMHTWELNRLLRGLSSLWSKVTNHLAITFSEPGLSLEAKALPDGKYRLQILLDHAFTPTWHMYPDFPVEMDIVLNQSQLQEAIKELSDQLATYPER